MASGSPVLITLVSGRAIRESSFRQCAFRPRNSSIGPMTGSRPRKSRNISSRSQVLPRDRDPLLEPLPVLARQATVLLEPRERVARQHLGPEVGVVTGVVAVRPDVEEVWRVVARRNGRQVELRLLQRAAFELVDVHRLRGFGERVPLEIEGCRRQNLRHGVALVECRRLSDLRGQRCRYRRSCQVVPGVVGKHLRVERPVLVEERGELDEITRDGGAGQTGVPLIREEPVQRVAELVKQREYLFHTQQVLAGRRPASPD